MMGQQGGGQDSLFYAFNLDDHVPRDHPLRARPSCRIRRRTTFSEMKTCCLLNAARIRRYRFLHTRPMTEQLLLPPIEN
jgi:hypothetical protein